MSRLHRRAFLTGLSALSLAGCDRITQNSSVQALLEATNQASYRAQRFLQGREELAPEYSAADISATFKANGTTNPAGAAYKALAKTKFETWRLQVDGLVDAPRAFSLAELKAMPARTQITRHDCVEGWSVIGQWIGVPLATVLAAVKPKPDAHFVVFHCADKDSDVSGAEGSLDGGEAPYYESIDFSDALHPQTILAYAMNGQPLPVDHGAPLRVRLERQLGYKMAKYIMRIELVSTLKGLGDGKGGYWEDRGYDWYAGV